MRMPGQMGAERSTKALMTGMEASVKLTIKRGLRRFGLDIRRRSPELMEFLDARRVDVVLDVGANIGQFGKMLRSRGYRGKIVSFEPIGAIYRELRTVAERDGNWQTHHLALGATAGRAVLNVTRRSVFSSILDQSPAAQRFDAAAAVTHQEEVCIACLDDLFAPFHNHAVFLKIDTQGYERPVLEGARSALMQMVGIQLELPIVHLYKDTWSLADALTYMRQVGFVVAQLTPVNWLVEDPVSLIEIDAIFRRGNSADA
jgi:FkbM family methyltransferase